MAEWRSLERWLSSAPQRPRHVVAFSAQGTLDEAAFRRRAAAWWWRLQDCAGEPVAIHLDDAADFAAALLAAWQAGCPVILPGDLHANTVAALSGHVRHWIAPLPQALAAHADQREPAWTPWSPAQAQLTVFTSGSSGAPQAIHKRASQLLDEVAALQQCFGADLGDAQVFATVSQQHIYGLLFRVLWPLAAGRSFARERQVFPEDIVAALASSASVLVSTPAHLSRLPATLDWRPAAERVRAVFSSGGPLSAVAAAGVRECLARPAIEVYGSSETGGIAWRQRLGDDAPWQPLPALQWRVDEQRLWVRSAYADAAGEWVATEDRAIADGDGFRLLGRRDRIVKIEERRVSLSALEHALQQAPGVQEARVLLLPGERTVLGAVIVEAGAARWHSPALRRRRSEQLRELLLPITDRACWPRRWRFVERLPCDARGKTSEDALRALFAITQPTPQWLQCDGAEAELECELGADLAVFAGHFPAAPVLPGVAMVDWAARWSRQQFAVAGDFLALEQLKFQRIARPGMRLRFSLRFDAANARVSFTVSSQAGQHASGRLRFASV